MKLILIPFFTFFVLIHSLDYTFFITREIFNNISQLAIKKALELAVQKKLIQESDTADVKDTPIDGTNPSKILNYLCEEYDKTLKNGKVPYFFDTTLIDVPSETVQAFTAGLSIPTVSTSFGLKNSIRAWKNLQDFEKLYQIHVICPADLLSQIVYSFVEHQSLSNALILYDNQFVMKHKVTTLLGGLKTRFYMKAIDMNILKRELENYFELGFKNYFFLGSIADSCSFLETSEKLNKLSKSQFQWVVITMENAKLDCNCEKGTVYYVYPTPNPDPPLETLNPPSHEAITYAFYIDIILRMFAAAQNLIKNEKWRKASDFVSCTNFNKKIIWEDLNLLKALKDVNNDIENYYAPLKIQEKGYSYMSFKANIDKYQYNGNGNINIQNIGTWNAGIQQKINVATTDLSAKNDDTTYRVALSIQAPFVMKSPDGVYYGLCIDLLNALKRSVDFSYTVEEVAGVGYINDDGKWDGVIEKLIDRTADIGLGAISVLTEREAVIDFTIPFSPRVGIQILMKKNQPPTSLFKFLTVLERDVWLCILTAYFLTSLLLWIFDRYSPYSYQNNKEKYKDDDEKRIFGLRESLWFCLTSLTPQGGGEAPKNLSGRLVAATWWLFGFIIIASYTANLAAFLTVSRLDAAIESIDDLAKQYKIQYAPVNGSLEMLYFQRMADIENRFYEIWKDMSLNDSLTPLERSKLAVWDYPVSDKFTRMWQAMKETTLPQTTQDALTRVKDSKSAGDGFAFIGDATDVQYFYETNCDVQKVGPEFSSKPYAIALQTGSYLLDPFNNAIQELIKERKLEDMFEKWWKNISVRYDCDILMEDVEGISIRNIGGVFIVIVLGIIMAMGTLTLEYCLYKVHKPLPPAEPSVAAIQFESKDNRFQRRRNLHNLPPVNNPYW